MSLLWRISSMTTVLLKCPLKGQAWLEEGSQITWVTPCTSSRTPKWCKSSRVLRAISEANTELIQPPSLLALRSLHLAQEEHSLVFLEEWTDNTFYLIRSNKTPIHRELGKDTQLHKKLQEDSSPIRGYQASTKWALVRSLTGDQRQTCHTWRVLLTSKFSSKSLSHTFMRQTIAEISQQLKPLNRCLLRREVTTSHQLILTTQTFCFSMSPQTI